MDPTLLVVRLSSLGDLIHTLPAVAALRKAFPKSRIDWLVETRHREVLLDNPDIDALIEVDTLGWRRRPFSPTTWQEIRRSLSRIRERHYDVVLDLQGTIKSSVSAYLARSDRRIGFTASHLKERAAALLYTERVVPRSLQPERRASEASPGAIAVGVGPHGAEKGSHPHAIDRHLLLLKALGIVTEERSFPVSVPGSVEAAATSELARMGLSDYAVLNPGGSWVTKRWSPEKFGRLAAAIHRQWSLPSLIIWGPGEEAMAREVVRVAGADAARIAPPTTVRDLVPYIRRARLFVSGDTGPIHLASACGVPAVGIFGPTDPARNGPFGAGDEVVWKNVPCGPCYRTRCPGYGNVCMTTIGVEEVLEAVRRRLGGK